MTLDKEILTAAMASRSAYERVHQHVAHTDMTPTVAFWWKLVEEYYNRDKTAHVCERNVLAALGDSRISNPKHRERIVEALPTAEDIAGASPSNVVVAALALLRTNRAAEFASAAMGGDAKKAAEILDSVNELWASDTLAEDEVEVIYASPVEHIFDVVGKERRIPILPDALNVRVGGGVLAGHHILVFGRTEIGKTCFVVNLMAGFVRQRKRCLYVGNEDEINSMKARMVCRITGRSWQEVEADREGSIKLFKQRGGEELLRMVHMQPGSIEAIRAELKDWPADVLVLDQIRNLSADEDGMTRKLEANAIQFRSLLAKHKLVGVSVTQASDKSDRNSADSPVWLASGDVDSSRVGLPAQADLMIGVGGDREMISRGQRALSICKNKLYSGPQSREGIIVNFDLARNIVT